MQNKERIMLSEKRGASCNAPEKTITPFLVGQLRTKSTSRSSDKSDVRSLRCKYKIRVFCLLLANYSIHTPPLFFVHQSILAHLLRPIRSVNKKARSYRTKGLISLFAEWKRRRIVSPRGDMLLSNLRDKDMLFLSILSF